MQNLECSAFMIARQEAAYEAEMAAMASRKECPMCGADAEREDIACDSCFESELQEMESMH